MKVGVLDKLLKERQEIINKDLQLNNKNCTEIRRLNIIEGYTLGKDRAEQDVNRQLINQYRGKLLMKLGKLNKKIGLHKKYNELLGYFQKKHEGGGYRLRIDRNSIMKISQFIETKESLEEFYPSIRKYIA